jgi:sterol desaturase/sphingolipid hydroxylase (fatty acid hydroxylase superfamily)
VHHSDDFFDVSTAVRFHPLEFAIQVPISLAAIVALGIPPVAIIVYELIDAAMAVWTHANVRLPGWLERTLNPILVTPAMHRIHHSADWRETDSNYGATLAIWDRLFGTYRTRSEEELAAMSLGLKECQDGRSRSLLWLLKAPFIRQLALRPGRRQS